MKKHRDTGQGKYCSEYYTYRTASSLIIMILRVVKIVIWVVVGFNDDFDNSCDKNCSLSSLSTTDN